MRLPRGGVFVLSGGVDGADFAIRPDGRHARGDGARAVPVHSDGPARGPTVGRRCTRRTSTGVTDLRWVQNQLGHVTIAQTVDTYGHAQPDRHEAAVNGLDQYVTP